MALRTAGAPDYLGLLCWLKLKLVWRTVTRRKSAAIGAVLGALIFAPISVFVALGCYWGFHELRPQMAEHLLRGVLLAAYALWIMSPILGYAITEDYDIAKLLVYPLSPRMLLAGVALGSIVDFGVLLLVPTLVVVLISFGADAASFLIAGLAVVLFLFHTVLLAQAVNLAAAGILRSRRGRDILAVAIPLMMTVFYVVSQSLPHLAERGLAWSRFLESPAWKALGFLPSGLAARAIGAASRGAYPPALSYLGLLAAVSGATLYLAGWLVGLVYVGEAGSAAVRPKRERAAPARPREEREAARHTWLSSRVPPAIAAVAEKELRYLVRDPFFKATIAQTIYMLAVFAVMLFQMTHGGRSGRSVSGGFLWGGIGMLLMVQSSLALNSFGPEGSAASLLFLFPCSRREILIGKNVVLFLGLGALNSVIATGLCLVAKQAHLLPLILIWTMLACALFVGCGNIMSALFPFRIAMKGWVMRRSASMGCSASLAYAGAMLVIGLLMLPVAAALVVPTYWVSRLWLAVTIPVAFAYVAGIYVASLRMTEEILREREPEIAARLAEAD